VSRVFLGQGVVSIMMINKVVVQCLKKSRNQERLVGAAV
jgi:hypothetical protein